MLKSWGLGQLKRIRWKCRCRDIFSLFHSIFPPSHGKGYWEIWSFKEPFYILFRIETQSITFRQSLLPEIKKKKTKRRISGKKNKIKSVVNIKPVDRLTRNLKPAPFYLLYRRSQCKLLYDSFFKFRFQSVQ